MLNDYQMPAIQPIHHLVVVSFCVWMCAVRRVLSYFLSKIKYTLDYSYLISGAYSSYKWKWAPCAPCPLVSISLPILSSLFVALTIPLSAPVSSTCLDSTCQRDHAAPVFLCVVYFTGCYVLYAHPLLQIAGFPSSYAWVLFQGMYTYCIFYMH